MTDPGGIIPPFVPGQTRYALPAGLSISAAGIRSIVFGAAVVTDEYSEPVNLASGVGLTITTVPEPATALLLALGLGAIARRRRR